MQILIRILVQICTKLRLNAMSIRTLVQICTKLRSKFLLLILREGKIYIVQG